MERIFICKVILHSGFSNVLVSVPFWPGLGLSGWTYFYMVILVSLNETDCSRELICAEMEDIEVSAGGVLKLESVKFKVNRGLLPLHIPLKFETPVADITNLTTQVGNTAVGNNAGVGHIQVKNDRRAVLLNFN